MLASGMNLITTVIGFGMSATFIVFIFARLICGRIRSADSRNAAAAFQVDLRSEPEHIVSGLDSVVIATLPTMKFDKESFHSREDAQCSICLGEYQERERLRIMPTCGHIFHLTCIDAWLQKKLTCPVCRLSLQDSFEAKHTISPASNTAPQSMDSPEVVTNQPYQWLLPDHETFSGNGSSQENHGSVASNLEYGSVSVVQMR